MTTYGDLTLKRGIIENSALRKWVKKAIFDFQFEPITVSVSLLNEKRQPIIRWTVSNAWPISWTVDNLHSQESKIAVETFVLAYDRVKIIA